MNARVRELAASLLRYGYYAAMYTGLRALYNRARGARRPLDPRVRAVTRVRLGDTPLRARFHARPRPRAGSPRAHFCVASLRMQEPPLAGWLYRALCATSHFGDGHVEVALYLEGDVATLYAYRNIARANARRLGLERVADRLRLRRERESRRALRVVADALTACGYSVDHAPPEECVALSTDGRLLRPASRGATLRGLHRKYASSRAAFATG